VSLLGDAAELATAAGVMVLAAQLQLARVAQRAVFEQSFNDRYDRIAARIPLGELLGDPAKCTKGTETAERVYFDYFSLCEEEVYYRWRKKVSRATWVDWQVGLASNLRRPAFRDAWVDLRARTGQFENLAAVVQLGDDLGEVRIVDPASRPGRAAIADVTEPRRPAAARST